MALRRCAACGAPVTREAVRSGRAFQEEGRWYCSDCADLIRDPMSPSAGTRRVPEPDPAAAPDDATVEISIHPVQRRIRSAKERERRRAPKSSASNLPLYIGAAAVGIGILLLIAILLWRH